MKNFKRFASVVMVLMMMLSMMLPAMADVTITITEPTADPSDTNDETEAYTAYKVFDATIASEGTGESEVDTAWAYSVDKDSPWLEVFLDGNGNVATDYAKYFDLTISADESQYIVEWKAETTNDGSDVKALAKQLYEDSTVITDEDTGYKYTLEEGEDETVTEGYYLIVSDMGTALVLATTDINVVDKNTYPTLDKKADVDAAQIGQVYTYTLTITIPTTANKEIKVSDTMESGITFVAFTSQQPDGVTATNIGNVINITVSEDYVKNKNNTATVPTNVVITYTAYLNKDAEVVGETGENIDGKNSNKAILTYSDYTQEPEIVDVLTYETSFIKIDGATKESLAGVTFDLYLGDDKVNVIDDGDGKYHIADKTEQNFAQITTPESGIVEIEGLNANTSYIIKEIETLPGYNVLEEDLVIAIETANNMYSFGADQAAGGDDDNNVIENNTGSILPSTGGIGTTIFYCAGAVLAVGAFVLLITKKRMSKEV